MKKILLISLLLASFGIAEEAKQETPKKLQDLGRGYAQDPQTNQIYYDGVLIEVYSPKTFTIIKEDNENGYDAEDHYTYYQTGNAEITNTHEGKVPVGYGTNYQLIDEKLNIPLKCFDDKDDSTELLKCYQREVVSDIWTNGPLLNPETFKVTQQFINGVPTVTDGHRVIFLLGSKHRIFSIDDIYDLSTFQLIDKQVDYTLYGVRAYGGDGVTENMTPEERLQWRSSLDLIYYYFKDKDYVYANGVGKIEGADPNTFEILIFPYARDKDHIFYKGKILAEANRDEFELLDYRLRIARDKTKIFYKDHILKELDLESFKLISSPFPDLTQYNKPVGYGSIYRILECPVALLMDDKAIYYTDAMLLEEPDFPVSFATGRGIYELSEPYSPDRLYGMAAISLPFNYSETIKISGSTDNCRGTSSIDLIVEDTTFTIERKNVINKNEALIMLLKLRKDDDVWY